MDAEGFLAMLKKAGHVAVLTGAGVSTASGIPDFRGSGGLYSKVDERTLHIDFFISNTEEFYSIAKKHLFPILDKEPNATHRLLARLESKGLIRGVITQNIDGLHQKAGSRQVIELHGTAARFHCMSCGKKYQVKDIEKGHVCACGGVIRPDIVFYGDQLPPDAIGRAYDWARQSDLFIVMGSSLVVTPASLVPIEAKRHGGKLIIINRGATPLDDMADEKIEADLEAFSEEALSALSARSSKVS